MRCTGLEENLISVIVTTYKRPVKLLKRAIDSAVAQTYKNIEIILVNDCPIYKWNSDIECLVQEYKAAQVQIQYYVMNQNSGACAARNFGVEHCNGAYLAFLDDDDIWKPNKLRQEIEKMVKDDSVLATGYVRLVNDTDGRIYNKGQEYEGDVTKFLLSSNFVGGCSVPLISKIAFDSVNGFDTRYKTSQDYNLWLKLSKVGKFSFVREIMIDYEIHSDSLTTNMANRIQGWNLILLDFAEEYKNNPKEKQKFCYMISRILKENGMVKDAFHYWIMGNDQGEFRLALKHFIKLLLPESVVQYIVSKKRNAD